MGGTIKLADIVAGKVLLDSFVGDELSLDMNGFNFAADGFVRVARTNKAVRGVAASLMNAGYVTDGVVAGVASFTSLKKPYKSWGRWLENFSVSDSGISYVYSPPENTSVDPGLLVVFSSISDKPSSPEMMRYFMQNFPSIGKFVPKDVGVLRLSDVGGMVGAFYMDTIFDTANENKVTEFLSQFIAEKGIRKDRVVFYGVSKGGTGALLHGVKNGVRVVSVDPIVNDEHYLSKYDDLHFVTGVFPERKEFRFSRLFREGSIDNATCIISSDNSPQLPYIRQTVPIDDGAIVFLNSVNPNIKDHPDVGPVTVNAAVMLMNMCFYDVGLSGFSGKIF